MAYNFRIHIHLGVHKTATTFIQNWLATHQPFLKDHAIAYVPLEKLRKQFTQDFWKILNNRPSMNSEAIAQLRELLFEEAAACGYDLGTTRLFVLSEENLLGSLSSLHSKGKFYPDLDRRMRLLGRLFEGYELQPFMALRSYSEFYPSAYAEMLRHDQIQTFDAYLEGLDLAGNSWPKIVKGIESVLGPVQLWTYERFKDNSHRVLTALLQIPIDVDMIDKGSMVRQSLTQQGLDIAMRCRDILSDAEMKRLVNLLADKMIYETPGQKIAIQDHKIIGLLNEKYQHDLERLSSHLISMG